MDSFSQQLEDFYPSCFSARSNPAAFPDPPAQHLAMSLGTAQKDFQEASLKVHVHSANDHQTPGSQKPNSPPKQEMVSPVSSADVTLGSQRRKRTFYSQNKLDVLEQFFQTNMYPDIHQRENLAKRIYIPESRVQVWFQNRRAKERRDKSKSNPSVGMCYPSVRRPNKNMYPSNPPPNVAVSQQHMGFPKAQGQLYMNSQQNQFQPTQESQLCPESIYSASQQRFLMQQAAHSSYHGIPASYKPTDTQQHLYRYMSPTGGIQEKVMDLSKKHSPMPFHPSLLMDFNNFPPNKTITPDMNVIIPPIPVSGTSNKHTRMNVFDSKEACPMVSMPEEVYEEFSPVSDSGVSDGSTVSLTDFKDSDGSVLDNM
ncbi:hypothetical protein XENTR_v10013205 [Xenopus tropicalis]|uniref:Mix n=2 Tax=Xenopus tropicalis TaxID=8364 RepID=Q4JF53_XENTR|nr:homeobox protein Mix.1 [Xenopus tropicalis]AAZ04404.1 mix [Xenopus tropicalis]KAE8600356.1 hypothetical protein XENTR_v10013205 [Xenopus tropicalis]KAE8600357.1 hypothetical protein XENTR_v10013205 [Xenopus tropicalis]